jgi:hypothetical protein
MVQYRVVVITYGRTTPVDEEGTVGTSGPPGVAPGIGPPGVLLMQVLLALVLVQVQE